MSSLISSYAFAQKQVTIYGGTLLLILGIIGGILTTFIFLTLRTFRQNSCTFYLTVMSIVNVGYLSSTLYSRIMLSIYGDDATNSSLFYCRFRYYFITVCSTISLTCFCLATIDQYCATCFQVRFQQWCNIKIARRLVIIFVIIWLLHAIPYWFFLNHVRIPLTNTISCTSTNSIFTQYRAYAIVLMLFNLLPMSIVILFGSMAYRNVRQIPHYSIPLVRRDLEKQLTVMVLSQVVLSNAVILPFTIMYLIQLNLDPNIDPLVQAQIQLVYSIFNFTSLLYFTMPFYVYVCASERFRRQLIFVLFKFYKTRCIRQPNMIQNQIIPIS
ncbi:hypothetical protein I4U23_020059 [Adineta vaga]|nr:hypothetical protein I4U23_020059 [Adineta vaga]